MMRHSFGFVLLTTLLISRTFAIPFQPSTLLPRDDANGDCDEKNETSSPGNSRDSSIRSNGFDDLAADSIRPWDEEEGPGPQKPSLPRSSSRKSENSVVSSEGLMGPEERIDNFDDDDYPNRIPVAAVGNKGGSYPPFKGSSRSKNTTPGRFDDGSEWEFEGAYNSEIDKSEDSNNPEDASDTAEPRSRSGSRRPGKSRVNYGLEGNRGKSAQWDSEAGSKSKLTGSDEILITKGSERSLALKLSQSLTAVEYEVIRNFSSADSVPAECVRSARTRESRCAGAQLTVSEVVFRDANETTPWTLCRCENDKSPSMKTMIDFMARLPIGYRQRIRHVTAVPGVESSVDVYGPDIMLSHNDMISFLHEVGHIIDTYSGLQKRKTPFSSEEEYSVAAKSECAMTSYADEEDSSELFESWAEGFALLQYLNRLETFPMENNKKGECAQKQFAIINKQVKDIAEAPFDPQIWMKSSKLVDRNTPSSELGGGAVSRKASDERGRGNGGQGTRESWSGKGSFQRRDMPVHFGCLGH